MSLAGSERSVSLVIHERLVSRADPEHLWSRKALNDQGLKQAQKALGLETFPERFRSNTIDN